MNIWRINLKSAGNDPDYFCIDNNLLGVGWPVDGGYTGMDWNKYYDLGNKQYRSKGDKGWWPAVNAMHNRMNINDFCWTRDRNGIYYLGRISGDWEYCEADEYKQADIVNFRPCDWISVGGVDAVPGKVLNSFRAGRTVQRIHDQTVALYSHYVYADDFELPDDASDKLELFSLVSDEDCEDFVGMYLQLEHGYALIPSTCKKDTKNTEFVLKNYKGEEAYVQVKQGKGINKDEYPQASEHPRKWFLFSTNGEYYGKDKDHIYCFEPSVIKEFVIKNQKVLSRRVQQWFSLLEKFQQKD